MNRPEYVHDWVIRAQKIARLGIWDQDPVSNELWWSDETFKILGLRPGVTAPNFDAFLKMVHPEDRPVIVEKTNQSLESDDIPYIVDYRVVWPDNTQRILHEEAVIERNENGRPVKITGIIRDITDYKKTEFALRKSEEKYRKLYDNLQVGLSRTRIEDGSVIECNREMAVIFGFDSIDEFKSSYIFSQNYVDPDFRPKLMEKIKQTGVLVNLETRFVKKDGSHVWVRFDTRIFPEKGYMEDVFIDITDQKRTKDQLIQAQKMESIGRLAGGIAHDFNNMLSVILGNSELALEKIKTVHPVVADHLAEIKKAALRSGNLTRQLLGFARKQTIAPKQLDLNLTLDSMLKMLKRLIGEDISLEWLPGNDIWPVRIDPSQVDQILANLCVNARDAIKSVGRITIETENIRFDDEYCNTHIGFIPGDFTMIAVSDSGSGIKKEDLGSIFEPFFTTKQKERGTGLGLATVYGIVKQNKGFVNVYSELGLGTTFKIYLPRCDAKGERPVEQTGTSQVSDGSETVLLLEDEKAILEMAASMLERMGYDVIPVATPTQALEAAAALKHKIQLVVTDVVMPEMTGVEVASKLSEIIPDIKYLYMSGYTENAIAHHGVLDEGVHFIHKPFGMKELAAKVREVLDDFKEE